MTTIQFQLIFLKNIKKLTTLNEPHFRGEKGRSFGASHLKCSFTNTVWNAMQRPNFASKLTKNALKLGEKIRMLESNTCFPSCYHSSLTIVPIHHLCQIMSGSFRRLLRPILQRFSNYGRLHIQGDCRVPDSRAIMDPKLRSEIHTIK